MRSFKDTYYKIWGLRPLGGEELPPAEDGVGLFLNLIGALQALVMPAKLIYYLVLDPRVPEAAKLLPLLALGYIAFPFDLVADVMPLLGQGDDALVAFALFRIFLGLCPPKVVQEYLQRLGQTGSTE